MFVLFVLQAAASHFVLLDLFSKQMLDLYQLKHHIYFPKRKYIKSLLEVELFELYDDFMFILLAFCFPLMPTASLLGASG